MQYCSFFIENKALFGSYPTNDSVKELENNGVNYFIDLTSGKESKTTPYQTDKTYINYEILDRNYPTDWKLFSIFIIRIADIIKKNFGKIYIHCKGGHGRSGLVVACLLCYMYNITSEEALKLTNIYHNKRVIMKDKWRKIGSPQTKQQKVFVHKFFAPLIFNKISNTNFSLGLSFFSQHSILFNEKDYSNIYKAYEDIINHNNYVLHNNYKLDIMFELLKIKFNQYKYIKNNLLNTGLRPIIYQNKYDYFWGVNYNNHGQNNLGRLLYYLREQYYRELQELQPDGPSTFSYVTC